MDLIVTKGKLLGNYLLAINQTFAGMQINSAHLWAIFLFGHYVSAKTGGESLWKSEDLKPYFY